MQDNKLPFLGSIVLASGILILIVGILVIIGWLLDITILKSLNPDYISMKANTAICFIFSGIVLILARYKKQTPAFELYIKALTVIIFIISSINLFEYVFDWNSGIDELLFKEGAGTTATIYPGRMAINTAVCFILICTSILIHNLKFRWTYLVSQLLALLTGLISVLPQLGYAYNEADLFTFAYLTPMALNTAILFLTLSIGIFFLNPTNGIFKLLGTDGPGGYFARRLFPVIFILPVFIIWVRLALKAGGYNINPLSFEIITIVYGLIFVVVLWKIIISLNENDSIRRKAEEDLKHSEKKFRRMFENAQDVFFQSDTEGIIIEISPSIYRVAGYRREELIGQPVSQFYDNLNDRVIFLDEIKKKGMVDDYELRLRTKSGKYIYTSVNAHLRFSAEGILIGNEGSLRQIDERKEFEIQLQKAKEKAEENDRLKTAFLHNISHEIRTPLNAILGFGALLSEPGISNEEQSSYLGSIQDGSDQLLSIISTILDISSAEAKVLNKHLTSFNLNSTLKSLHKQFLLKTSENSNTLELNPGLSEENALIRTDSTRLVQIISNLLTNALKFTINGKVEFGYKVRDSEIEFYVSDSGIGIPSDQHIRIFDSFYQVESAFNRKYGGTGLGLSICKAYVELLGGRIWISSEPGVGSIFYFTIPFEIPVSLPSVKQTENKIVDIGKDACPVILVVEDNEINFSLINRFLSGQHVKIIKAKNGKEAVDICKSVKEIDLVLMDIRMPVMDGYIAAKLINEIRPALPVIAQTAYAEERGQVLKSGFVDFIAKPFNKKDLLEILTKHLSK